MKINIQIANPAVVAWFVKALLSHSVDHGGLCERWIESHQVWCINRPVERLSQFAGQPWLFMMHASMLDEMIAKA